MKRFMIVSVIIAASVMVSFADDRPVAFAQLPQDAQTFINKHFRGVELVFATMDDDFIRPDYKVVLEGGVELQFEHDGSLDKIEVREGVIPAGIVPSRIIESVKAHYPNAVIMEYEVGKKTYEVKLSNGIELQFSGDFRVIDIDD